MAGRDFDRCHANVDEDSRQHRDELTDQPMASGFFGFLCEQSPWTWRRIAVAGGDVNGDGSPGFDRDKHGTAGWPVLINTDCIFQLQPTDAPVLKHGHLSGPQSLFYFLVIVCDSDLVVQTNSDLSSPNWGTASYIITTNETGESITIPKPPGDLCFPVISSVMKF